VAGMQLGVLRPPFDGVDARWRADFVPYE